MKSSSYSFLLIIILFCGISFSSTAQPCTANAGPNVTICQGQSVTIGGNPSGTGQNPLSFSWNNGAQAIANPTVSPGVTTTYTLTVTADNNCTATDQMTVTVLPSPTVNVNFSQPNPCSTTPVQFTSNVSNCTNCQYSWNFGNPASGANNTSTQANPAHTFVSTGSGTQTFTVTLTVTSQNGCSATQTVNVTVNQSPNAVLTEDVNFTQCLGIPEFYAYVTNASQPANNSNYTINWGDGSPNYNSSTPPSNFEHIYTGIGIWTLTYTVTGTNGCTSTATYPVSNITNAAIGAATSGNTQQCGPVQLCFDLNSYQLNHPSTTYTVNFGDGSANQSFPHPPPAQVCHNYTTSSCPGSYTFTITANNNCSPSTVTISPIQIYTPPTAQFTNPPAACAGSNVTFTNTSFGGFNQGCNPNATYAWNFGDPASGAANTSTATNGQHVYANPGTYTVTLTAGNAGNPLLSCGTTTFTQTICIETPPTPAFTIPSPGCVPFAAATVNTSNPGTSCAPSTNWTVNYSDNTCAPNTGAFQFTGGTNASSLQPQFNFQSAGVYTVNLNMTNSCGTFIDSETVTVNTTPTVSINPISAICAGGSMTPSAVTNGCNLPITNFAWSFPGGSPATSNQANPGPITYANSGTFNVTLTITNACGTATSTVSVTVQATPTVTVNPPVSTICSGQSVGLTATGALNYSWSPGTGLNTTSGANVTASPTATTIYTVTGSTSAGCSATAQATVNVNPLPTVNIPNPAAICAGQSTVLNPNIGSGTAPYTAFSWSPSTGLSATNVQNPTASPNTTTTYTLTVTDSQGCQGSGTVTVTVNPLPVVNAGNNITLCNQPVATQLTGFSPAGGTWSGSPNVTPGGQFTPNGIGSFVLTYTFTNANGCTNSANMTVTVIDPTPANAGPDVTVCQNVPAFNLVPVTAGGTWSGTGVNAAGLYTPATVGTFTLTYTLGAGSCQTTDQVQVTVNPLPVANAGPDVAFCAGLSVPLAGTANGGTQPYTSTTWNNAATLSNANILNPVASPASTTTYTLTVIDANNCQSSDAVVVTVNPLPAVNAGNNITLCDQPIAHQLTGFSPAGGTWSGSNVTPGGLFTPNGQGAFVLTYSFTNANGCTNTANMTVTVTPFTQANGGPDVSVCLNSGAFNLVPVTPGGTWSGSTMVTGAGVFTPNSLQTVNLTYTLGTGTCLTTDQVTVTVNPLPVANAGPNSAFCAGLSVQLNGSANGGTAPYTSTVWNNAASLSNPNILNPIASPASNTTYTLTVTDSNGCQNSSSTTVTVNPLPAVNGGSNVTLCDQPIAHQLTGFSPAGGTWSGANVTSGGLFTPNGTGAFVLTYSFTNTNNCTNTSQITVTIDPVVQANAGPDFGICHNAPALQINPVTPGGTWTGAGVTAGGLFTPSTVGNTTLTYSTGSGTCLTTDQLVVTVHALPVVNAGPDLAICGGLSVQINGTVNGGTPPYASTIWSPSAGLNDNTILNPVASPAANTNYTLTVTDSNNCQSSDAALVTVNPLPTSAFTVNSQACTNSALVIANNSIGNNTYQWDFDNGDTSGAIVPAYTYPAPGNYNITLTATNQFGCVHTSTQPAEAINPPLAALNLPVDQGCAPLLVTFENNSVGQYLSYFWDLALSTTNEFEPAPLNYPNAPATTVYPVSLTATNYCGSDVATTEVTVTPVPVVNFGTDLDVFCSPFTVQFNNLTVGEPNVNIWDFGDGTGANTFQVPPHIYFTGDDPTVYTITLTATNDCGTDTGTYDITVLPNTVTAFFNSDITFGCPPLTVNFTNFSSGATDVYYAFGDALNSGSNNPNPTFTFTQTGNYTVFLYADNGCSFDTTSVDIIVFDSPALSFTTNQPVCLGEPTQFVNTSPMADGYTWNFGDGNTSNQTSPAHTYASAGTYNVTLSGQTLQNNCGGQTTGQVTVLPAPVPDFTVPDQTGCTPFTVQFANTTTGGNFYEWNFGDGTTSGLPNPTHTFMNPTGQAMLFPVTLSATNLSLCSADFTFNIIVSPSPVANFLLSETESCGGPLNIQTTNTSVLANTYAWTWSGGGVSTVPAPSMTFSGEGTYTITLNASNSFGCPDSHSEEVVIYPQPQALFSPILASSCPPLTTGFQNFTSGATNYQWTLGNGETSAHPSPVATYEQTGQYTVGLIASNAFGCADTLTLTNAITVHPVPVASFYHIPEVPTAQDLTIQFQNASIGAFQNHWTFDFGQTSNAYNPAHTFQDGGSWPVTLLVINQFGCSDETSRIITIQQDFLAYVPNAFTPDGDNINDYFLPIITGADILNYKFQIFDRWGEKIFETEQRDQPWIGNYKGGDFYCKNDVYVWRVELKYITQTEVEDKVLEGHVTLLR